MKWNGERERDDVKGESNMDKSWYLLEWYQIKLGETLYRI